jgi:hypothetical protein
MKQAPSAGRKSAAKGRLVQDEKTTERKTTSRATVQSKIRKAKTQAKIEARPNQPSKKEKSAEVEQLEAFTRDSELRRGIVQNLLSFINRLPAPAAPYFNQTKNLLQWQFPIPSDLAKSISNDPISSPDPSIDYVPTYEYATTVFVKGKNNKEVRRTIFKIAPINVISAIRTYNSLLFKYPYSEPRAKALQALEALTKMSDVPVLLESLLYNDQLVSDREIQQLKTQYQLPQSFINLIEKYNELLSAGPHRPLPSDQSTVTVGWAREKTDAEIIQKQAHLAVKSAIASYRKAFNMLEKVEVKTREDDEEADVEAEEKIVATKETKTEDIAKATLKHAQNYRDNVRLELANSLKVDPSSITNDQIADAILRAQNMPAWVFILRFVTEPISQSNTRKLIVEVGNMDQFGRIFQRLPVRSQIDFAEQVLSDFHPTEYPNGPNKSLLTLLTSFSNNVSSWTPDLSSRVENKLITVSIKEFPVLFRSLNSSEILRYRDIIFGKIPLLPSGNRDSILQAYSGLLTDFISKLVFDTKSNSVQLLDETNNSLRPAVDSDFTLQWNEETRTSVQEFISNILSYQVVVDFNLSEPITINSLSDLRVKFPDGDWVNLLSHIQFLLSNFYHSLLPIQLDFTTFVSQSIVSSVNNALEQLSHPTADPSIAIPTQTLEQLSSQLKDTQTREDLAFSGEELMRQAYSLGLDIKQNIRTAAGTAEIRLNERVRRGEISPEERKEQLEEINRFVEQYTELTKRTPQAETADLKRKRREFAKAYETTLQTLTSGMERTWESIRDDAWATLKASKTLKKTQRKELRRYIDQLLSNLRTDYKDTQFKESSDQSPNLPRKNDKIPRDKWEYYGEIPGDGDTTEEELESIMVKGLFRYAQDLKAHGIDNLTEIMKIMKKTLAENFELDRLNNDEGFTYFINEREFSDRVLKQLRPLLKGYKNPQSRKPFESIIEHEAWKDVENEGVIPDDKLTLARDIYLERFDQLIIEAINQGLILTEKDAQEQARSETESQGILTDEEISRITVLTSRRGMRKDRRQLEGLIDRAIASQKKRLESGNTKARLIEMARRIPEALRLSLAETVKNVSDELEARNESQIGKYYKFISAILIASWNVRQGTESPEILKSIELEYTRTKPKNQQIELSFVRKVIDMIRDGQLSNRPVTWNDLLKFTMNYTQYSTMLIKNPLEQQTGRRKRRYDRIFNKIVTQGDIGIIRREISEPLPPYIKECIAAHQLKPWLNIKHIHKWVFLVSDSQGRKRDQMSETERMFFNVPQSEEIAVLTQNGKKLYFYKPTTAYWIKHCRSYHEGVNAPTCDTKGLLDSFTGSNPQFYELLVRPPFGKAFNKMSVRVPPRATDTGKSEIVFHYSGDNKRVKFLSMDPTVYEAECAWFSNRYAGLQGTLDSIRSSKLKKHPDIRRQGKWIIKQALSNLRLKYGKITSVGRDMSQTHQEELDESSTRLEQALYDFAASSEDKRSRITVYSYLKALFELTIPIDVTDPVGTHAKFFQNMVAQCSDSYYSYLLQSFPSLNSRLPEIFLLPSNVSVDLLKQKVSGYIESKIDILIKRSVLLSLSLSAPESQLQPALDTLKIDESNLSKLTDSEIDRKLSELIRVGTSSDNLSSATGTSINELFTKEGLEATTHLSSLTLKNICVNADDYKDLDDSWLVYYNKQGKVYCISKLQLAGMAEAKEYSFNGVKFPRDFVDGFGSYADFSSQELGRKTEYIKELTQALTSIPENKELFQGLVTTVLMFEFIGPEDVANVMRQINLTGGSKKHKIINEDDAFLIMIVRNKLQELVNEFIASQIADMTEAFINENRARIQKEINEARASTKSADPLAKEYKDGVFGPTVDAIIRSIETTSDFRVSASNRALIDQIIQRKFSPQTKVKKLNLKCESCKAHLATQDQSYRTVVQQVDSQTRIKLLTFCSQECFSGYKINEPTAEEANFFRLQNAVNVLTSPYLSYNQMVLWSRFPSAWKLPTDKKALRRVVRDLSKIKGLSDDEIINLLPSMGSSESFLGIYTTDEQGNPIPEEELWDRIRTSPHFVPSIVEIMDPDKYEAFKILTRTFDIPTYDGADWDAFYSSEPEELIGAWKLLRSNSAFKELLFSTVETFDPYQTQKFRPNDQESASSDLLSYLGRTAKVPSLINRTLAEEVKRQTLEAIESNYAVLGSQQKLKAIQRRLANEIIRDFPESNLFEIESLIAGTVNEYLSNGAYKLRLEIGQLLNNVADLNIDILENPDRLKVIRQEIINEISKRFLELGLDFNLNDVYKLLRLRKTLRVWFINHMLAHELHTEVELTFERNEAQQTLSSAQMLSTLSSKCRKNITANALSTWTFDIIKSHRDKYGNSAPDQTKFQTDFYSALKRAYYCESLNKLEEEHARYVFNLEKVSGIIDETAARIIESRQHQAVPKVKETVKAGAIPRHKIKLSQRGLLRSTAAGPDLDIKEQMKQIATGEIQIPEMLIVEDKLKTETEILTRLQELRRAALRQRSESKVTQQRERAQRAKEEIAAARERLLASREAKWAALQPNLPATAQETKTQERELKELLAATNRILESGADVNAALGAFEHTERVPLENIIETDEAPEIEEIDVGEWDENAEQDYEDQGELSDSE